MKNLTTSIKLFLLIIGFTHILNIKAQKNIISPITDTVTLAQTDSFYYTTSSLSITSTGKLIVEKGVEIRFANGAGLSVAGTLQVNGTKEEMALFTSTGSGSGWSYISANNARIILKGLHVQKAVRCIAMSHGDLYMENCIVDSTYGQSGDDCIGVHDLNTMIIKNCSLDGSSINAKIDAIDCDGLSGSEISGNTIINFGDDGIDFGTNSNDITIKNNFISNCNYGITIGENTTAVLSRNVIIGCGAGIQSHTGASTMSYNNTLYKNQKGVECHHGSEAGSAGSITVNSCIVSSSIGQLYTLQSGSVFTSLYSISDTDTLPGETNIFGNPCMVDPDNNIFHLLDTSVCINAGDPSLPKDTAGNNIDIGAFEFGMIDTNIIFPPVDTTDTTSVDFNSSSKNTLWIYPNPSYDVIYIENVPVNSHIKIISLEGRTVLHDTVLEAKNEINIAKFHSGLYFIIIQDSSGEITCVKKFMKQ